jgi:hypothetical protein
MNESKELNHAQILKNTVAALSPAMMPEPNVELVMPLVTQGVEAYNYIKQRTALIREELNAAQALVRS